MTTERPASCHQARRDRNNPTAKHDAIKLEDVVIVEVDGLLDRRPRPFPREIGIAYGDGRNGLAWLIAPEAMWPQTGSPPAHHGFTSIGTGMHPVMMVRDFLKAIQGCRVYSESHLMTGTWLSQFFAAASTDMTFRVRDLRTLLVPSNKSASFRPEDIQQANQEAAARFGPSSRAAQDAAKHVAFTSRLYELRRQRFTEEAMGTGTDDEATGSVD